MNKAKLTAICHKIKLEKGLPFNTIMLYYFLESILKRLSRGRYGDNIIFKGGFLLSNVVGIETRSTIDIDLLFQHIQFTEEKVSKMLHESLDGDGEDEIKYEISSISPIREQDYYEGYRASILCKLENLRLVVPLDITTEILLHRVR